MLSELICSFWFDSLEQVRMVADLPELHEDIMIALHGDVLRVTTNVIDNSRVPTNLSQELCVKIDLEWSELNADVNFDLVWKFGYKVTFSTT
jgi:hypothetical protein